MELMELWNGATDASRRTSPLTAPYACILHPDICISVIVTALPASCIYIYVYTCIYKLQYVFYLQS